MEDIFDKEENAKNIYVIRHKLADLKAAGDSYHMEIGPFQIVMRVQQHSILYGTEAVAKYSNVLHYEKLNVFVYEKPNHKLIKLREDPRFKDYKPIQYNIYQSPGANIINLSDGYDMPILHLCELIKLLTRLSNLTAFM